MSDRQSGTYQQTTRAIPGTDPQAFQLFIEHLYELYAVWKLAPDESLDPQEATITLGLSKKGFYDLFADISLNRLSDPDDPVLVFYLRGSDTMKAPRFEIASKGPDNVYVPHLQMDPVSKIWMFNSFVGITPEGGFAQKYKFNITAPAKGQVVRVSTSANNTVSLSAPDTADPIGVLYDGIRDADSYGWVVTNGKAYVLFANEAGVSRKHHARVTIVGDYGASAGYATGETFPLPPFSTDKHFQEIGHVLETTAAPGLALTALHFN